MASLCCLVALTATAPIIITTPARADQALLIGTPSDSTSLGPLGRMIPVDAPAIRRPTANRDTIGTTRIAGAGLSDHPFLIDPDTKSPMNYGAICDGTARPLSTRYTTLAAAQSVYGATLVTALNQDIDTVAWQSALATGRLVTFPSGRICTLRARLTLAVTGGIIGDGTGRFVANATDFSATVLASNASDTLIRSDQGRNIVLRGFGVAFTSAPDSFTRAVAVTRASGILVERLDLSGFNAGNLIEIDSSTDARVQDNVIRDGLLDRSGSTSQLTGIAIDDNLVSGVASRRVQITGNTIRNLLVTAAFRASYGYQSDGITVLPSAIDVAVTDNTVIGVGEGIDFQASGGKIAGNTVRVSYQFGIKLIHGASNNTVSSNAVTCPGIGGITVWGGSAKASADNMVVGNSVTEVNCLGEYDRNTTWAFGAADNGLAHPSNNNTFVRNVASGGEKATAAYYWAGVGTGNTANSAQISGDYRRPSLAPPFNGTPMSATLKAIKAH
ncbi:right-handed parallel beta-helix repeat-containing protein [Methylobacterium sp. L1A1]|nr:right-handed parallel beta-helix repeat-containing protein [Methylobacterium sp. L1A1]